MSSAASGTTVQSSSTDPVSTSRSSTTTSPSTTTSSSSTTTSSSTSSQTSTTPTTSPTSTSTTTSSTNTGTAPNTDTASQSQNTGSASASRTASDAVVTTSVTTTDSAGSTIVSTGSTTVPTSRAPGGSTSYQTITVTDSSGNAQETTVPRVTKGGGANIGAIVGGTVGGVVGLLAILLLLWFCVFKKRRDRKGDFDDMMFDPGRNRHAAPGQTDILDDEANNDVEPYTYGQNNTAAGGIPQMSQYNAGYPASSSSGIAPGLPPLNTMGASTAVAAAAPLTSRTSYSEASQGGANVARGPSSASTLTSAGFAGRGAQPSPGQIPFSQFYQQASANNPSTAMPVAVPTGGQAQTPLSAAAQRKAREAAQERQALRPANPSSSDGAPYYPSHQQGMSSGTGDVSPPTSATTSGVLVHRDAGSYVPEDQGDDDVEGPSELPPQYHSIRRE